MSTHASQLERLTFFSDAVFAIAITLLVIEIHVPRLGTADDHAYLVALHELLPSILGFVLSFLVIGALWAAHHRVFGLLEDYDSGLVMPNLLLLMVIAFMPFATALMSANPLARVPELFYAGTLLTAGCCSAGCSARRCARPTCAVTWLRPTWSRCVHAAGPCPRRRCWPSPWLGWRRRTTTSCCS